MSHRSSPRVSPGPSARRLARFWIARLAALAILVIQPPDRAFGSSDADALLVVDCLLPPEIRKLGARLTYAAPRRPVRTSGADCAERGGEYALPSRTSQASSLAVWLPGARAGDAAAQNRVAEIYESGSGGTPDPELAAIWYRRAAEQGHEAAMVQLGQLHETGAGVARDPALALRWYERASGLDAAAGGFVPSAAPAQEDRRLADELGQRDAEIAALRAQLAASEARLARLITELRAESAATQDERGGLDQERRELADREATLADERAALAAERERLDAIHVEAEANLEDVAASLARREDAHRERVKGLDETRSRITQREEALAKRQDEIAQREREIEALQAELERARADEVDRREPEPEPALPVAPPSIQLIEPNLPPTRGLVVSVPAWDAERHVLVGRVVAPAGLLALTVNGVDTASDARGLFRAYVEVAEDGLDVTIAAVDRRGKRAIRKLRFDPMRRAVPPPPPPPPALDFGRYVALVIGNNRYQGMPSLTTAVADATRVAQVLEQRYGFEVRLLENATRYDILSALNDLRGELTEEHNLLLYYAGHGELDEANARGHWLPTDAEPESSANWISNVSITDVLNAMAARHVLVVADSCYSGTLTRTSLANLASGMSESQRRAWVRAILPKRSRTALTSGGLEPVLDVGGGRHSVFARVLLEVLESNDEVLEGQRLFREVSARVTWEASNVQFAQIPEYAPIKFAGHEAGDFFFVPRGR